MANASFSDGSTDWTSVNLNATGFNGYVSTSCGGVFGSCWDDGSMKGYDQLSQSLATALTPGDTYVLSFYAYEIGGTNVWSKLSTDGDVNGGNGVDILAYVGGIDGPYRGGY